MHKPRRKKILLLLLCFFILLLGLGYIFRYPLILQFQYSRLKSLGCAGSAGCMGRLWVHRVNSVERYELLKDKFTGFETDINYDPGTHAFYVYHPPLTGKTAILPLSSFLQKIDFTTKNLWLDTRSVDTSNMHEALNALAQATDTLSFNHNVFIVELYDITAAKLFAENGFPVAFNVSDQLLKGLLKSKVLRDSINKELRNIEYISQEFRYVTDLKKCFPDKMIITWRPEFKVFFNTQEIQELLDDPQIEIILVNIKSRYYK
jgi:hypothetical protein